MVVYCLTKERLDAYGYNLSWMKVKTQPLVQNSSIQFKRFDDYHLACRRRLSVITEGMHGLTDACIILANYCF